jgi:hypothetical protein
VFGQIYKNHALKRGSMLVPLRRKVTYELSRYKVTKSKISGVQAYDTKLDLRMG